MKAVRDESEAKASKKGRVFVDYVKKGEGNNESLVEGRESYKAVGRRE